eukprot:TRINITY_DN6114_c0_g1_i2.p1 TRINITY_DN6114_c0_g1~~TRINITY_DN6114_c0_g1_i2.p1  ORF type:complete len:447 (-),score=98.96 TRINITY_DN6114_c0_g1_i2:53-1393(-)
MLAALRRPLTTLAERLKSSRWQGKVPAIVTAEEAVRIVQSGDRVFVHTASCAPNHLLYALTARANELTNVEFCHLHLNGPNPHLDPKYAGHFFANNFFLSATARAAVAEFRADWVPVFLSEVPSLFHRDYLPPKVALISVSPPDKHGWCSLGPSVDVTQAAIKSGAVVIAQVNKHVPRTHGQSLVHISAINFLVEKDEPLPAVRHTKSNAQMTAIGMHCAALVEDGSTLQMGIGGIPDATLQFLTDRKDLGIHTEMFTDGLIPLVEKGVITNNHKVIMPGKTIVSFAYGSQDLYDFVDDNVGVEFHTSGFVNDPAVIKQNPKVVAINSAIEIDLTGQVCADSIGHQMFSGIGGQVDFERGAALSPGGKPIIAIPSVTSKGETRIVSALKSGAGVVTSRGHVHWIVTEYGRVNLHGKNLRQRAEAMISIAHPEHRDQLRREAKAHYG